jgi:uridine kinase
MRIVALTGGSGSGKSTVLNGLMEYFQNRVSILSLDDYYRPREELPKDSKGETNYDVPEAINHKDLYKDLQDLSSGKSIALETYTYNRDAMKSERIKIDPSEWLIVEGLFVLHSAEVREMLNLKVFIDATVSTRLSRRKHRDLTVRGYSPDEVQYQWDNHVRPADEKFIEPWKERCDLVIDNENNWKSGLEKLINMMES